MDNTLENKARFFAQYIFQRVLSYPKEDSRNLTFVNLTYLEKVLYTDSPTEYQLELKALSSITDEDAIECNKIHYGYNTSKHTSERYIKNTKRYIIYAIGLCIPAVIDYLRSKGYALPYMGLSIEKQIEYGWVKLIV